jgi:hypothetical protein
VTATALQTYLADVDPAAAPALTALDEVIRGAHPGFDVAVKYHLLMYALDADWRTWVCAINATKKGVCLRFLYGVLLDDPLGVLRAGSSVLKTWDIGFDDELDVAGVASYVTKAVARYPHYKANAPALLEQARLAGTSAKKSRSGR